MEEINNNKEYIEEEESSIDFGKIFQDLLKHKTLYYKVLPVAFLLAAIYAILLPNYYSCTVKLAPELGSGAKAAGGLASLASSFGVNLGGAQQGADAISPTLYPDLMNSVDFKTSLFSIPVKREDDQKSFTDYRTSKARVDLEYNKKLYAEAKAKYEQARNRYAAWADSHRAGAQGWAEAGANVFDIFVPSVPRNHGVDSL